MPLARLNHSSSSPVALARSSAPEEVRIERLLGLFVEDAHPARVAINLGSETTESMPLRGFDPAATCWRRRDQVHRFLDHGFAQERRHLAILLRQSQRDVSFVTRKRLIATIAVERNRNVLARFFRDVIVGTADESAYGSP